MRFRLSLLVAALIGATCLGTESIQAQQADVVRGRVIGPDSVPIEGAQVTVTSLSGNVNRGTRTNKDGRFTVTFPNGEGDYIVSFAALGFAVKRFEVKRTADEEILVADAKLTRAAVNLEAMKVTAPREKVARNDTPPDISGTERSTSNAGLPPADLGDLAAMAATLPGVQLVPGQNGDPNGFSVLGLGADQNNTTLNGMSFGASNLPRDAAVSTSLVTSPYDVSRGGFSGGQLTLRTRPGSNFITRGMSLNLDAPQMQWTDRAAQALGQQYSNISLGGLAAGPMVMDKAFYNVSYQIGRRANDYQSLLNTGPLGLETAGVAPDSVDSWASSVRRRSRSRSGAFPAIGRAIRGRSSAASISRHRRRPRARHSTSPSTPAGISRLRLAAARHRYRPAPATERGGTAASRLGTTATSASASSRRRRSARARRTTSGRRISHCRVGASL